MKEFEDALIGAQAGDCREFNATFAADHPNKKLAGKTGDFQREGRQGRRTAARAAR